MSAVTAFVLGLLVGWLTEWVVDWIYWRHQFSTLQEENAQMAERLKLSEMRASDLMRQLLLKKTNLTSLKDKLTAVEAELAQTQAQLEPQKYGEPIPSGSSEALGDRPAVEPFVVESELDLPVPIERDDLEIISGIGPVIAQRLNQAGIHCFEDLAVLTPEKLREMVGDVISRLADEESIIVQAKYFAEAKGQKSSGG